MLSEKRLFEIRNRVALMQGVGKAVPINGQHYIEDVTALLEEIERLQKQKKS